MRDWGVMAAAALFTGALMFGCLGSARGAEPVVRDCLDSKPLTVIKPVIVPPLLTDEPKKDDNDWLSGPDMTDQCYDPTDDNDGGS